MLQGFSAIVLCREPKPQEAVEADRLHQIDPSPDFPRLCGMGCDFQASRGW